jgi:NAD+ synthase|uniref:NAD synthase n=1 Tax=virus sp. ctmTa7 TaxID=2828255 RepID=A0A8S5RB20_9VIRU|nr:MAG TPA: NAD synthase [virus sp. ctmTa7]
MHNFNVKNVTDDVVKWVKNLFEKNFPEKNCCIALSGGKDSSVVAAISVNALGRDKVKAIMLPQHEQADIDYSILCAEHLGIEYKIINIGETVDSIISEMKSNGVNITEQAITNVPARIRMAELYFYAQCNNGIPSCNCNLSEDWVGYATYGGDGFGSFAPLSNLTVTEVKAIGRELGLPKELIEKIPTDGLCGKTDEDNLGFTYDVLDKYIRTGKIDDLSVKEKIDSMHEKNLFKLQPMPYFKYTPNN